MVARWISVLPRPGASVLAVLSLSLLGVLVLYHSLLTDHLLAPPQLHTLFLRSRHVRSYPILRQPCCCCEPPGSAQPGAGSQSSGPHPDGHPGPSHPSPGLSRCLNSSPRLDPGPRPLPRGNTSLSPSPSSKLLLLLAIKSHPSHWERRAAIRSTWGKERSWRGEGVRRVFLLGQTGGEEERGVAEESRRHGDILQWGFRESFFNVTLKEVLFWNWYRCQCSRTVRYVLKGDDDVFVDVERVVELLQNRERGMEREGEGGVERRMERGLVRRREMGVEADKERGDIETDIPERTGSSTGSPRPLYMGRIFSNTHPVRLWWSKYYVPYFLHTGQYPAYAGGAGYLLSNQALLMLSHASSVVPLFPIDDAYVGMVAKAAGVPASPHPGFLSREYSSTQPPCLNLGLLVLHKLDPRDMMHLWSFYQTQRHTCGVAAQPGLT